ncbi:MAG TPA: ABC transporter permease [Longimicrobium sp.]|nr:ABC transporter permease [Longimicrobium sp.]
MDSLLNDLRYALRAFARAPGFALTAVLTLALGIGVNTAVFSVANAVLLRPPEARDPGRIARVYRNDHSPLAWREFDFVRQHSRSFGSMWAERNAVLALETRAGNEKVQAELVSGSYFPALGVTAALGRLIAPADDSIPGASPVVVLSHRYWRDRFGGDSAIVGRTIRLNGRAYTVAGVAREGFANAFPGFAPQLWAPMAEMRPLTGVDVRDAGSVYVAGRLNRGIGLGQANADARVLAAELTRQDPARRDPVRLWVGHARGLTQELRGGAAAIVGALQVVTLLVLLIACTNVANLLLARAAARRREIGIRLAVGASRWRLVRQLLTESVLLALAGGTLGLLLSSWLLALAMTAVPAGTPVNLDLSLDGRVLGFTVAASLFAGIVFGLAPAFRASRPDVLTALKEDTTAPRRSRLRALLVGAQVALCTVLLAGSALFLRSLGNASRIDPGFDPAPLLVMPVDLRLGRYDERTGPEFYRRLLEGVGRIPGVRSASLQQVMPLQGDNMETRFTLEGEGDDAARRVSNFDVVSAGYFRTLGIPVLRGREFGAGDRAQAPPVAIVNQTFARRNFPNGDALGRRVSTNGAQGPFLTIVAVVRDAKYVSLGEEPRAMLYVPFGQNYVSEMVLHVRAAGDPAALVRPVARAARALDPVLPFEAARPMRQQLRVALLPARIGAWLLGGFGSLALLLAAVGIYGVVSYTVSQRTREIGIRAALGAGRRMLIGYVIAGTLRVVGVGMVVGVVLALLAGRAVRAFLYGVAPTDPAVLLGTPLVLALVALAASWAPVRRATAADPMTALRAD